MTAVKIDFAQIKKENLEECQKENQNEKREKKVVFIRRDTRPGVYKTMNGDDKILIINRGIYIASDPEIINLLDNDPEVIRFSDVKKTRNKK